MRSFSEIFQLREKKDHLIDKLRTLNDNEKDLVKQFFNLHPQYESKVDWNNLEFLHMGVFDELFKEHQNSKSNLKRQLKSGDLTAPWKKREEKDFKILWNNNEDIYITPLSWECAAFMNSFDCYGIGAKWCIGYKNKKYWSDKIVEGRLFIMRYSKELNSKYMFDINYIDLGRYDIRVWTADDDVKVCSTRLDDPVDSAPMIRAIGSIIDPHLKCWKEFDRIVNETADLYESDLVSPLNVMELIEHAESVMNSFYFYKNIKDYCIDMGDATIEDFYDIDKAWRLVEAFVIDQAFKGMELRYSKRLFDEYKRSTVFENKMLVEDYLKDRLKVALKKWFKVTFKKWFNIDTK